MIVAITVLASVALIHAAWWLVGDFVLERVGIPFLDGASTSDPRAARRDARYDFDRRSTGMSRDVRA